MTEVILPGLTAAYAHIGAWHAQCSYDDRCGVPTAVPRFTEGFVCRHCGMSTAIVWPSPDMVHSVERLLLMRPHWKNQNWLPGETLQDLVQENLEHGIFTMHGREVIGDGGVTFALGWVGDRITVDALPMLNPRRELVR